MEDKSKSGGFLEQKCSRKTALKAMAVGSAGLFVACNGVSRGNTPAGQDISNKVKEGTVTSHRIDKTGDTVSMLGLGCMRLPRLVSPGNNAPSHDRNAAIDQKAVNEMVDYAIAHGINYFDTAPVYGRSQEAMGIALSRHPRDSYFLATKMSNFIMGNAPTLKDAELMFNDSLNKLKVSYFDYYLLHSLEQGEAEYKTRFIDNGVLDYLLKQKAEGRIRHLGFSFHGDNNLMRYMLDQPVDWEFIMIQMNYLDWKGMDVETLYKMITDRKIPVIVMEPVRGGALANMNDRLVKMMAEKHPELSPAAMALKFCGSFPNVMLTLSGMSNLEQTVENINTFTDFKPLDESDFRLLEQVAKLYRENPRVSCTDCNYCLPCPYGINIPGNFDVFNKCSNELNLPDPSKEHDKEYMRKRRIFLNRYKNTLSQREQAEFCIGCKTCVPLCPQWINIPEELKKIEDLVKELKKG